MRLPSMRTSPPLGVSRPAIMRSRVDLPQPEGPSSTVTWPSGMTRSMPGITSTSPKRLLMERSWISAMVVLARSGGRRDPGLRHAALDVGFGQAQQRLHGLAGLGRLAGPDLVEHR